MSVALQQTGPAPANTSIVPLKAGNAVQAFVPTTYDEAWRMSQGIVQGGFNPPSLKTPQAVMQAIIYGLEVGMKPFMALKNIAIINGRPAVYGDGLPGLVYASGLCEFIEVTFEGEGDSLTATCTTHRKGSPRPVSDRFSVADAKKAGVWGKAGPWSQYPRRMLGIRARSFVLRDAYADIIGGLDVVEEVMDLPAEEYQDVTPPPATAEGEESAPAPAIARKPRAKRTASAPPAEVGEEPSDVTNATAQSDAPPAADPEVVSEEAQADDGPPPVGDEIEDAVAEDVRSEDEVFADFTQCLQADQSEADIGATWDRFESEIKGHGPGFTAKCSDRYVKRRDELRGETAEERKARLKPAFDDGVASFFNGRKPSLGVPKAFKDGGEFEKTWLKGYERAKAGEVADPNAAPPASEAAPSADADPVDTAYEAGRAALKAGISQRGIPGEYRDPARKAEADAWLDGWRDASRES